MLKTTLFRAKYPVVGLDIGSSGLKAVQLTPAVQACRVAAFAVEPLPPGAVVDGVAIDRPAISEAIRGLFERAGFGTARVAAALPCKASIVKRITLPAMTGRELDEAIRWEAEQHIPFPLTDVQLHYESLGATGQGAKSMDVLLIAAHRDSIAALAAVIRDAGQTAAVIDVTALALQNAYTANRLGGRGLTVALVDIGASATTVTIRVNRDPAFVRHLTIGGHAYTEALQRALGLSFQAAEAAKKHPASSGRHAPAIEPVLHATTAALVGEIGSTLDFFRSTTGAERIDRLFVSGGGSLLAGLIEALRQRLSIQTVAFDPFRLLGQPARRVPAGQSLDPRIAAVAVGLALHQDDGR